MLSGGKHNPRLTDSSFSKKTITKETMQTAPQKGIYRRRTEFAEKRAQDQVRRRIGEIVHRKHVNHK